jgi:MFS family permease
MRRVRILPKSSVDLALVRLVAAVFAFQVGGGMTLVALPLLVLRRYGAGFDLGATIGVQLLPNVLLGPTVGQMIDEFDPRVVAIAAAVLDAAALALLPQTTSLWQIESLAVVTGVASMFGFPAMLALRGAVVGEGEELRGNRLIIGSERFAKVLGPLVSGPVLAAGSIAWLFRIDAGCELVAAALLVGLTPLTGFASGNKQNQGRPSARRALRSPLGGLVSLVKMVRSDRALVGLTVTAFTYVLALGVGRVFLAAYAVHYFRTMSGMLGYLIAAMGAGGVVGALATSLAERLPWGATYVAGNAAEGVCWLLTPAAPSPGVAVGLLFLAGIFESVATVIFFAGVQRRLPKGFTGRYFATLLPVSNAFYLGGALLGGALIAGVSLELAAIVICVSMAAPVLLSAPLLRGLDQQRDRIATDPVSS